MIEVRAELRYDIRYTTSFALEIAAAESLRQHVVEDRLVVQPSVAVTRRQIGDPPHDLTRFTANPGELAITYDALVRLDPTTTSGAIAAELPFASLPDEVLSYLNPSRYCESDQLARFANTTFGSINPGYERITGICNWIFEHMEYVPGSTDSGTTATDVLVGGAGVCRDYAHLAIALSRALGVPARYVSGYAVDLQPQDFHGFFEAYLGDDWYLFDATRMAPLDGLVRICVGRDAGDAAFATFVGNAELTWMEISVIGDSTREAPLPTDPIATA